MSKPKWTAQSTMPLVENASVTPDTRMRPICRNCGWRLAKVIGEQPDVKALLWCEVCEAEHGGQPLPAPKRLPELPTKKRRVDEFAVKDKLAAIGAIPITCKACGQGGHVSADCRVTMGYVARDRAGSEVDSVIDAPSKRAEIGQRIAEWRAAGYAVTREPIAVVVTP